MVLFAFEAKSPTTVYHTLKDREQGGMVLYSVIVLYCIVSLLYDDSSVLYRIMTQVEALQTDFYRLGR